jgi:hypothetical protein
VPFACAESKYRRVDGFDYRRKFNESARSFRDEIFANNEPKLYRTDHRVMLRGMHSQGLEYKEHLQWHENTSD